ncbi:MAG: ABC transporter permease [Spirochaetales bacterium]|uniref:Autoinducer 2 import system permease protein LsrD n=1 Tax=Candidatus Thalassospirochaeta sargassi TaxID=3119039 RepID=A0AAJ1MM36_9SPIO|nr:ABC transporter permease [Spirochaetales bacterium]
MIENIKTGKNGFIDLFNKFRNFREGTLILIIVAVCVLMSFLSPYFMTWANWKAIFLSFSTEGIVVVGMTVMLVLGGIDLSVGAVMCLAMCIGGKLFLLGVNPWLASLIALAICAGIGYIQGLLVTKVGLVHFITTLAFMGIARGACFVITQGTPLSLFTLPQSFKFIGQGTIGPLPFVIIIFLVIVIVSDYMLRNSTVLRKVFYSGSNEKAAVFSGIRVSRVKIGVSVLCCTLSGLAGIIYMSRFGASTPGFGVGLEMTAISAAVIGGASLTGGEGTVFGSILGAALLSIITSSLILLDVSVYWQDLIKGCILLFAVSVDHIQHMRRQAG